MTIQRVNESDWNIDDTLTSQQTNLLDINTTYAIDKRDGYSDVIQSELTFASGSSLIFDSGSVLAINSPSSVFIGDGNLNLSCSLTGNTSPLRFGYASFGANSNATQIISAADSEKEIIEFTGTLIISKTIYFPTSPTGYRKIFNNATTGNFSVMITTLTATNGGIFVSQNRPVTFYCDSSGNLILLSDTRNKIKSTIFHKHENSVPGTTVQTVNSTTPLDIIGYSTTFTGVKTGDTFEIKYNAVLASSTVSGDAQMFVTVVDSGTNILRETQKINYFNANDQEAQFSTLYTATSTSNVTVKLQALNSNSPSNTTNIKTPLSFTVIHRG